ALAAMAIVVAGVLAILVIRNLKILRHRSWEQLAQAQVLASRGQGPQALQSVQELINSSRSGKILVLAYLLKGDLLLSEGKNEDAISAYQSASREAGIPEYKALALAGLAAAHEQAGNWPEAEIRYQQFIKEFPEHFLAGRIQEALGRVYMAQQKWTDAQSALERLVTLYPTTVWAQNAQDLLSQIKQAQTKR
ncbi:MAG: tetratricopeptide repeat protein, partial [Elusimicrobia bacterium]|nr:tetratricopeptide repeat protein [Elusimicrobiota bacterium]